MGIRFPPNYTNLVAFFTVGTDDVECSLRNLRGFFGMLEEDRWRLISSEEDSVWPQKVREVAAKGGKIVDGYGSVPDAFLMSPVAKAKWLAEKERKRITLDDGTVSLKEVFADNSEILRELTELFRESHELFVLGIGSVDEAITVAEFLEEILFKTESPVSCLFLIPDEQYDEPLDFMDPFPGATQICRYPERWPGTLIWNRFGNVLFLPLVSAEKVLTNGELLAKLATNLTAKELAEIEEEYLPSPPSNLTRILHLSDLHFGTKYAANNQDYLLSVIKHQLQGRFERIVITGDLFDSPFKRTWQAFENFRNALRRLTPNDPIVVPGNHDNRILGNALWHFGQSYKYLAELGGTLIHQDPQLQCLFFCFNSNKAGDFARGEVLEEDLVRMGAEYHLLAGRNADIENWLKIALVHHHPFKFDAKAEGATAKVLKALNIPESKLVDMAESERFICWCADRGIQLILHGHRHVQRKITQIVPVAENGAAAVTAVGCGTSLGAEGIPSSFNLLTWVPSRNRWSTAFYRDHSGGGFKVVQATSTKLNPLERVF